MRIVDAATPLPGVVLPCSYLRRHGAEPRSLGLLGRFQVPWVRLSGLGSSFMTGGLVQDYGMLAVSRNPYEILSPTARATRFRSSFLKIV